MRLRGFVLALVVVAAGAAAASAWYWLTPAADAGERRSSSCRSSPAGRRARSPTTGSAPASGRRRCLLYEWFRWSGKARLIRAGSYEIGSGTTPVRLLEKMVQGDETLATVRLNEGWTFRQIRAELARAEALKPTIATLSDDELMAALGAAGVSPEGRFQPDTYAYSKGSSDLALLKRAYRAMQRRLLDAWNERDPATPLKSADEALTLASIVEKETGVGADRGRVAGVLVNRLRIGMPLQTDPTVIYGLGPAFDGNLRKRDLLADTPYNSYTRTGLPPTPISVPGKAALLAAVRPRSDQGAVLRRARRRQQRVQRDAGRAQSRGQPLSTPGVRAVTSRFITFEGIDGAGKSTHVEPLAARLRARGHQRRLHARAGGTPLAEQVRELLLREPMDGLTETLLAFAARRDHVERVIAPALARGEVVLCDRFTDATFAYQGHGRGQDLALLTRLEAAVQGGLQPDVTLWFDVEPARAAERRARARAADRFEAEDLVFFERVRAGYLARMTQAPGRFVRIDSSQEPANVRRQIDSALAERGILEPSTR